MHRNLFLKQFKTAGPAILPVIHTLDYAQAARNIEVALREGAHGVFLINHDFEQPKLIPILKEVRLNFPWLWLGVNFLGVTGKDAFPILGELEKDNIPIDAYWADNARIDERTDVQTEANEIDQIRIAILIATGINIQDDFYNIDALRLQAVLGKARAASFPDA